MTSYYIIFFSFLLSSHIHGNRKVYDLDLFYSSPNLTSPFFISQAVFLSTFGTSVLPQPSLFSFPLFYITRNEPRGHSTLGRSLHDLFSHPASPISRPSHSYYMIIFSLLLLYRIHTVSSHRVPLNKESTLTASISRFPIFFVPPYRSIYLTKEGS